VSIPTSFLIPLHTILIGEGNKGQTNSSSSKVCVDSVGGGNEEGYIIIIIYIRRRRFLFLLKAKEEVVFSLPNRFMIRPRIIPTTTTMEGISPENRQTQKTTSSSSYSKIVHPFLTTTTTTTTAKRPAVQQDDDDGENLVSKSTKIGTTIHAGGGGGGGGDLRRKGCIVRHYNNIYLWIGLLILITVGFIASTFVLEENGSAIETVRRLQSGDVEHSVVAGGGSGGRQQQHQQQHRKLEFVHIPKTGGTVIERVAAKHGVRWAICHFMTPEAAVKTRIKNKDVFHCPATSSSPSSSSYDEKRQQQLDWMDVPKFHHLVWWHLPPSYFFEYRGGLLPDHNPYQGDVDLFAVVRDPYDRLFSEYYYHQTYVASNHKRTQTQDVRYMNAWVSSSLKDYMNVHCTKSAKWDLSSNGTATRAYLRKTGHFIPQYEYIYNTIGSRSRSATSSQVAASDYTPTSSPPQRVVQHVLKFETLPVRVGGVSATPRRDRSEVR
jgi:hypothetical protein